MSLIPIPRRRWLLLSGVAAAILSGLGCLLAVAIDHVKESACSADASRYFISKDTSEATIRALITRNGGEEPDLYRLP